ncbi:uncharacterized protein B0T15DRAFT_526391 [Chaetomium strumarium]|uniref:Peroxin/Ferlin domain-containing protein n=1 Tax=Chaetomium strumarium TaxID=1170767 RepID=A0AAJ0M4W4_9PEZI|nr:hypothetical protein B0T15DRAFT_526391 [Chaetomium strumarium]
MPKIRAHRSSRRVPPPKDSDFDHEIDLVNRDDEVSPLRPSLPGASSSQHGTSASSTGPEAVHEAPGSVGGDGRQEETGQPCVQIEQPTPQVEISRARPGTQISKDPGRPKSVESAIDILYENQRGGFLCGIPLFSSKALGNLDPPPWTNYAHKPSPTNIHTAQVPDPTWEWAWPEWRINHDDGVDEDGWEYSFAFSRKFSWHRARWWNSFVRRRAWVRKRVKKDPSDLAKDPHMLNPEYFTIRPSSELARDHSPSRASSSRLSTSTANMEGAGGKPAIENGDQLLRILRGSRIDREKIEAVDNYLDNAQEELEGLQQIMHEIMSLFVFQASRRILLSRLTEVYDKTAAERKNGNGSDAKADRRVENLAAAVKHADEEVRRLEYWSDVKSMAEEGESKGAVDHKQGWDPTWRGVDKSGPSAPPAP